MFPGSHGKTGSEPPHYAGNVQLMEARFLELSSSIRALYRSNADLEDALVESPGDEDFLEAIAENKALITKQKKELTDVVQSMKNLGSNVEIPDDIQVIDVNNSTSRALSHPNSSSVTSSFAKMYSVKMMGRIWYLFGALLIVSLHINAVTAFVVPGCRSLESMTRRVHHTSSPFGIPLTPVLSSTLPVLLSAASGGENDEIDLFEYFDPLLSPHAYPDGVSPNQRPKEHRNDIPETTLPKRLGFALPIEPDMLPRSTTTARNSNTEKEDLFDYFDPLLSPHAYPQGINPDNKPDELIKNTGGSAKITKRVGILIIDHGSKKSASNARLQALAELYQSSMDEQYENDGQGDPLVIVKAAHMEIASPSIPDGLRSLHDAGVDEIICHPFFLSPDGRHVKEDIPEIISGAIETLNIRIPVITTEPVGSNIPLMLNAIHTLVVKNSEIFEE